MSKLLAYYLPQYHPIKENNEWWGEGFTEWHSVAEARPLFKGHIQPKLPGELGFYDLRLEETRIAQAKLAAGYGIHGFCYWHYWLGNKKIIMEKPLTEVINSGQPDFPFCLAWANHDWRSRFYGGDNSILLKQTYPSKEDIIDHFYYNLQAFKDDRYIKVNGKPLFIIYSPKDIPNCKEYLDTFRELAVKEGFKGLFIIGEGVIHDEMANFNLDGVTYSRHRAIEIENVSQKIVYKGLIESLKKRLSLKNKQYLSYLYHRYFISSKGLRFDYLEASKYFLIKEKYQDHEYPTIISGWDTTPRRGSAATIFTNYSPESFRIHLEQVKKSVENKLDNDENLVFVKSWNEWGEGNYLEPDQKFGRRFLEVLHEVFKS